MPALRVVVSEEERSPDARTGFLQLHRVRLALEGADGTRGESMTYDYLLRKQMDAAVIVAHCRQDGERHVYLRSAPRPPLALRPGQDGSGVLWELPAGLVDPGESPAAAAARELGEELGFDRSGSQMKPLGGHIAACPAVIAELQYFFAVEVDPATRTPPREDGALEKGGVIVLVSLTEALGWVRQGDLVDGKTEIGLRRLAEMS